MIHNEYAKGGRYYVHPTSGHRSPGVTSINDVAKKPGIENKRLSMAAEFAVDNAELLIDTRKVDRDAAVKMVRETAKREWDRRALAGSAVHTLCEEVWNAVLAGDKPRFAVTATEMKFLQNLAKFKREFNVRPLAAELCVWNQRYDYAGRIDLLCRLDLPGERDVVAIVDTKTGQSGVFPDAALQQTAYLQATHWVDETGPADEFRPAWDDLAAPDRAYALWLRPNGWALYPLVTDDWSWQTFLRRREDFDEVVADQRKVLQAVNSKPLVSRPWRGGKS